MDKNRLINDILASMIGKVNDSQLKELKVVLDNELEKYDVKDLELQRQLCSDNEYLLLEYTKSKVAVGIAQSSIGQYTLEIRSFGKFVNKEFINVTSKDITGYLFSKQVTKNKSITIRNKYSYLNAFFTWLQKNNYMEVNPMASVNIPKSRKQLKNGFTDEEITKIKDSCKSARDRAIIDLLNCSMIRVGELIKLNIEDIDFDNRQFIVEGKGGKQRTALFDGETKLHLKQYIDERTDNNPALIVGTTTNDRMGVAGVRYILKKIGEESGVDNIHPHRFRRAGATRCLNSGMPINVVQTLLGHSSVDTTQIYAETKYNTCKQWFTQLYS